ncbi:MAG: hypothetical protein H6850_03410 [Alphaproteobacteria bacterium]|nr:MAG: hypothetical protein H6850_03410 [Alphaproteobacteria bacterium]
MAKIVTSKTEFIETVFDASGAVVETDIIIAFDTPTAFHTDTTTANTKMTKDALQAVERLTFGDGSAAIVLDNNAFSGDGFEFTNLTELIFNANVTTQQAVFGVNNATSGAKFPKLKQLLFNEGCVIDGSELFGAFSSGGNAAAAELNALESIAFGQGVEIKGDNLFGIEKSGGSGTVTAPDFQKLTSLILRSAVKISGNQFFGSNDVSLTHAKFRLLEQATFLQGVVISGDNAFRYADFSNLSVLAFQSNIDISGVNAFNPITTPGAAGVCIETPGIKFVNTTFGASAGTAALENLRNARATEIGQILDLGDGTTFRFTSNTSYGNCSLANFPAGPSSTGIVTSKEQFIETVFDVSGKLMKTDITFAFDVPTDFYEDPVIINGKTVADVLKSIKKLTLGDGSAAITINDEAFSGFEFTELTELTFNSNITTGQAVFGVNNKTTVAKEGAQFPKLKTILFKAQCAIAGSELFGAFSSNGNATAAKLEAVETIMFEQNVTISGNNAFGIEKSSGSSGTVKAPEFKNLTLLILQSSRNNPVIISGNQLFGSNDMTLMHAKFDVLQQISVLRDVIISGDNAFRYVDLSGLTLLALDKNISISGANTFNPIATTAKADICIENPGITFVNTTFGATSGTTELTNLTGLQATNPQEIVDANNTVKFNFSGAGNYGSCASANFPGEIQYTDLVANNPQALANAFVTQVAQGNTNIRFTQSVPAKFHSMPGVDAALAMVTHLAFGEGIVIHDQAFGFSDIVTPALIIPKFNNLQSITFEAGCIAAGDQIFGVFAKVPPSSMMPRIINFPRLTSITIENKVQIAGDDLFGASASSEGAESRMLFPVLETISIGKDVVIRGDRVFGSTTYTGGVSYGADMPRLTTFAVDETVQFKGDCFLGATTQFFEDPPKSNSKAGVAFGARIGALQEFIIAKDVKIDGDCFCGAASPKGGLAFGAIFENLTTFTLGENGSVKGDNFFGASELSLTEEPQAMASGAFCPRLTNLNLGKKVNISGEAGFSAKRSGYPINKAYTPRLGTPSEANGFNNDVLDRLEAAGADVSNLRNQTETQTNISLGAETQFGEGTFGLAGSSPSVSPAFMKLDNASSNGTSINFSDGSSIGSSNGYNSNNVIEKSKNPITKEFSADAITQNLSLLFLFYSALAFATWLMVSVSGPSAQS